MTDSMGTLVLCLVLAALIVSALSNRKVRTAVSGLIIRDKKGRYLLVLTPATKKGKGRR